MVTIMDSIDSVRQILDTIKGKTLYLVGAGENGLMIGEYLDAEKILYAGYIDRKQMDDVNGKQIFPYEFCQNNNADSIFFITSPKYAESMATQLEELGANHIFAFSTDRLVYELYAEHNYLMGQWIDGAYRESSFGNQDPDKTYMVMERSMIYEGIFSNVRRFLLGMDYADKKGFIPVIDQVYYPAFEYQNYENIGYENPWEYFYEQPSGVGLEYVSSSCKNVRYYNMDDTINFKYLGAPIIFGEDGIKYVSRWHELANKYLRLQPSIQKQVDSEREKLFPKGAKILGTKFRELMIVNLEKKCNRGPIPIQPDVEEQIRDIKKYVEEWKYDYIYLMCETVDILERMKKEFGDKVIFCDRERGNISSAKSATEIRYDVLHNQTVNRIKTNIEYIIETYLLAACDALIGGPNGAIEIACILKGKYEHMKLYYHGYSDNFIS